MCQPRGVSERLRAVAGKSVYDDSGTNPETANRRADGASEHRLWLVLRSTGHHAGAVTRHGVGKGVVMDHDDLPSSTRKAAERERHTLSTCLYSGEKRNRKRVPTVAAVYDVAPHMRTTGDVIDGCESVRWSLLLVGAHDFGWCRLALLFTCVNPAWCCRRQYLIPSALDPPTQPPHPSPARHPETGHSS